MAEREESLQPGRRALLGGEGKKGGITDWVQGLTR